MNDEEFRITKIELQNYRQYYGTVTASFSEKTNGFSVFLGENGEGKSNLLNAINWCLFKVEPHQSRDSGLPIINLKCLEEANVGSIVKMKVTIYLQRDKEKYQISRSFGGIKHEFEKLENNEDELYQVINTSEPVPKGFEILDDLTEEKFFKAENDGEWEDQLKTHKFDALVSSIIPRELSEFFILDGEFLERLFTKFDEIKNGIVQISQLNIIRDTVDHISDSKLGKHINGLDNKLDEITYRKNNYEYTLHSQDKEGKLSTTKELIFGTEDYYHQSGMPRLIDLELASTNISKRLKENRNDIIRSNAVINSNLEASLTNIKINIDEESKIRDDLIEKHRNDLIKKGPMIMLKNALSDSNDIINNEIDKGSLPNRVKKIFTEDLISKGTCICGAPLTDGSLAKKNVETVKQTISDDTSLDVANEMKYRHQSFLESYDHIVSDIDKDTQKIISLRTKILKLKEEQKSKQEQIKNTADYNYQELLNIQEDLEIKKKKTDEKIGSLKDEIGGLERKIKDLIHQITNHNTRNRKAKEQIHYFKISESVKSVLTDIRDTLSEEIRNDVAKKTTDFFKSIMWKADYFDRVTIDENYQLQLVTTSNFNAINNLAAGERLFLTLAFIAALRQITGYKFPLVIDTPLGKIAGRARKLLAKKLPEFLPNSQLTLLATDTEYLAPIPDMDTNKSGESFREILQKNVEINESRIKFDRKTLCSTIIPYGGN